MKQPLNQIQIIYMNYIFRAEAADYPYTRIKMVTGGITLPALECLLLPVIP